MPKNEILNSSKPAGQNGGAKKKRGFDGDGLAAKSGESMTLTLPDGDGHNGNGHDGDGHDGNGHDGDGAALTPQALTRREMQVLKMLALGMSSKEIATKFKISAKTVDVHRAIIRRKLGIFNIPGLVKYALRTGLINLEE